MPALAELIARWERRRDEWKRLGVQVDGAAIAEELLCELTALERAGSASVMLREAAELSGYSIDHLRRLVAAGRLENVGKGGRIHVRKADLPLKLGQPLLPTDENSEKLGISRTDVVSQIMRSVA